MLAPPSYFASPLRELNSESERLEELRQNHRNSRTVIGLSCTQSATFFPGSGPYRLKGLCWFFALPQNAPLVLSSALGCALCHFSRRRFGFIAEDASSRACEQDQRAAIALFRRTRAARAAPGSAYRRPIPSLGVMASHCCAASLCIYPPGRSPEVYARARAGPRGGGCAFSPGIRA